MNHNEIILECIDKLFEYEKLSRSIDSITDLKILKDLSKLYLKLYLKQQEVISKL